VEEVQSFSCAENIKIEYLKYFVVYKNDFNSIQWTRGYTGLLQWNHPGFDTDKCRKALFLSSSSSSSDDSLRTFFSFFFLNIACFLLAKNTRKYLITGILLT
jgi:hypothetical protein